MTSMEADDRALPAPLPTRINLGCGHDLRAGYLNVDLHARHGPDLVADVVALGMLPSGHFEEIVAQDVLEHLERHRTEPALREWSRLLAPGGVLVVRVPSLFGMFEMLSSPAYRPFERAQEIVHLMYGTQAYTGDYHLTGFTPALLDGYLRQAGLLVCEAAIRDGWLFDVRARKAERLDAPVEFIHGAYFRILGRPADAAGLAQLTRQLERGELTPAQAEEVLAGSAEARFLATNPVYLLHHRKRLRDAPASIFPGGWRGLVARCANRLKRRRT